MSIMAAVLTNTVIKGGIAWIWGGKKFKKSVIGVLGLVVAVGLGVVMLL